MRIRQDSVPNVMWRPSSARMPLKPACRVGRTPQARSRVHHDLVRRHGEHAFDPCVVEGGEANEAGLDRLVVSRLHSCHQRVAVLRDALVDRFADLEATARVDGVVSERPVGSLLRCCRDPGHLAVPDVEELRVAGLVQHEGREEHHPVEASQLVRGGEHREELVGNGLLSRFDPDGDREDAVALILGHPLPVGSVL